VVPASELRLRRQDAPWDVPRVLVSVTFRVA